MLPFNRIKSSEIVFFTRQLSSMIVTGLTLLESLNILKKQTNNPEFHGVINDLIMDISEGKSFSDALSKHKTVFSEVYISLIKAAEKGGLLDKILSRLADNLEKSEDLKKRVKSAMFYPAIVVIGVVIVIVIMNVLVIPQLSSLYESLNVTLPLTTKIVIGMSKGFTTFFPVIILGIIGMFFLYKRFKKTESGIKILDKTKLRIPIIGPISQLTILDEVTRTLSLLIGAGTSIIEALNVTANIAGNIWYKEAILKTALKIEKGVPLSHGFQDQNLFPQILVQMIKVGESTGKMDENLQKVGEYFERDLDLKIKTLTTSIEPILIIFLGVTVGFLIMSIIMPIYSIISHIQ